MTKLTEADRIRRRREALGLSRREIAELTGLPTSKIWASEHEKIDPAAKAKIVTALNARIDAISKLPPLN